jgi:hypothetical protein
MSKYHFQPHKKSAKEQCLVGSLTGEVDSYNATESHNGRLITDGNRDDSAMVKAGLTARLTSRAGTKVGHSDPPNG